MTHLKQEKRLLPRLSGAVLIALLVWSRLALALPTAEGWAPPGQRVHAVTLTAAFAPQAHRFATRAEHSLDRFIVYLGDVGMLWLWIALSVGFFLVFTAFSSVADVRMLDLRRAGPGSLSRYLAQGVRTFFRVIRDRRTPYAARLLLLLALVYWLIPFDIIPDTPVMPGFVDDLVVAFLAAKGFMYLCPDSLIAGHAAKVAARARA